MTGDLAKHESAFAYKRTITAAWIGCAVVLLSALASLWRFVGTPAIYSYDPFFGYYPGALYDEAVNFVLESRRASISAVQRKLKIGYNRAARLVEDMEKAGLVSAMSTNGQRDILVPTRDE